MSGGMQLALRTAFASWDLGHARSQQLHLGPSDVAGCLRRAAYQLHQTEPTDAESEKRAAALGTFIHDGLLPHLAQQLGDEAEVERKLGPHEGLSGHADLLSPTELLDIKTCSQLALDGYRSRQQPREAHLLQLAFYADLARREGYELQRAYLLYLSRESGEAWVYEADPAALPVEEAWHRWGLLRASSSPEELPREERGPGLSVVCDGCAWRTACWGPPGDVAPQAQLLEGATVEAVAEALAAYRDAMEREKQAKADKEWARALLDATPPDTYGGWQLGWGKPKEWTELDPEGARLALELAGIEPPMRVRQQKGAISVRPAKGGKA